GLLRSGIGPLLTWLIHRPHGRLFTLVGVLTLLSLSVWLLLLSGFQLLASALIGITPVLLLFIYERWVSAPLLRLVYDDKKPALHSPALDILDQQGLKIGVRRFERLEVRNDGWTIATNCIAWVQIIDVPRRNGEECPAPSKEPRRLHWAGLPHLRETVTVRSIYPRGGREILDVVFAQLLDTSPLSVPWGESNRWGNIVAWLATYEAFIDPRKRLQDGLIRTTNCQPPLSGRYLLEITVHAENGAWTRGRFSLSIGPEWNNIKLRPCQD
ncbi:MAG: hypothetical protein QXI19_08985, partial [Candidatus Caldarchaeum sp.]